MAEPIRSRRRVPAAVTGHILSCEERLLTNDRFVKGVFVGARWSAQLIDER